METLREAVLGGGEELGPVKLRARSGVTAIFLVASRHRDCAEAIRRHGRVMAIRHAAGWRLKVDGAYVAADEASADYADSLPEMVEV